VKKMRIVFAVLAFAAIATAESAKYKDWPKSPEAYFLTSAERAEWAKVATDEDAEKFIATYYAKRGGDRFKEEIARRITASDNQFKLRRQRGAESARGRLLIVLGGPSRVSTSRPQDATGGATGDSGLSTRPDAAAGFGGQPAGAVTQTWIYGKEKFDPSWGINDLNARVVVDTARGSDELQNRAEVERAMSIVAEKSIVNPNAAPGAAAAAPSAGAAPPAAGVAAAPPASTAPSASPSAAKPAAGAPAAAAAPAASAAPPAPAAAAIPAAVRSVLDTVSKEKSGGVGFWGGSFHTIPGEGFYSVELAVPNDKPVPSPAKFAGVVTTDAGQEVATYWEDAALVEVKSGSRTDHVYEKSVVLPPGSYRGSFALFASEGTPAIASGQSSFQVQRRGTDFEVSPLILASTLTPLTKRPAPTDPFVFGMEKPIRVDPKGSRQFGKDESLWYFYTVENPSIPDAAPAAAPAPAATAAPAGAPGAAPAPAAAAPAAPAAPAAAPAPPKARVMARIGVLKDGQPAFKPVSGIAELQPLGPGYFATGTEIPLAGFEPGYYTFTVNVRDLNAPKDSAASKGIDRQQDFIVLKPDGTLPEKKAAAAPPKPAPTARPKK